MKDNAIIREIIKNLEVYKAAYNLLSKVSELYRFVEDLIEDKDKINDFYIELEKDEKALPVLVETLNDYSLIKPNTEQYIRPVVDAIHQLNGALKQSSNYGASISFEYHIRTVFMRYVKESDEWVDGNRWNPSSSCSIDALWCSVNGFLEDLGCDIFANSGNPPMHEDLIEMMAFLANYDFSKE